MINSEILSRFLLFFVLQIISIICFFKISKHYVFENNTKPYLNPTQPQLINKIWSIIKWGIFSAMFGWIVFYMCFKDLLDDKMLSQELFRNSIIVCCIISLISSLFGIDSGYKRLREYFESKNK